MKTKILALNLIFIVALTACLKANDDAGIVGDNYSSSGLSFDHVLSKEVSSAYMLEASSWEQTAEGLNIFRHLLDDDYFGLEVLSSGAPMEDLKFLLSKSTREFINFLGLEGSFSSQTLSIKLPESIFSSGILLTASASQYDPYAFTYHFVPAGSVTEQAAQYSIGNDNKVSVLVTGNGSIVVRPLPAGSLTINEPSPYQFRIYHDQDPLLRTFTWTNVDGTASCSKDGGTSWGACTTPTSLELEPAEFNSYPKIMVKVDQDGEVKTGMIDLNDASEGYNVVTIYECTEFFNDTGLDINSRTLASPDAVLCMGPGTYNLGATGLDLESKPNAKIIGSHLQQTKINGSTTFFKTAPSGGSYVSNIVLANLWLNYTTGSTSLHVLEFSNDAFAGPDTSENILSNVKITTDGTEGHVLRVYGGHKMKIYNCDFQGDATSIDGLVIIDSAIEIYASKIATGDAATIAIHGNQNYNQENFIYSSRITATGLVNAIRLDETSYNPPKVTIYGSRIQAGQAAVYFYGSSGVPFNLHIEGSVLEILNVGGVNFSGVQASVATNYNLSGSDNTFCNEEIAGAVYSGFVDDTGLGTNATANLWYEPASFSGLCPAPLF